MKRLLLIAALALGAHAWAQPVDPLAPYYRFITLNGSTSKIYFSSSGSGSGLFVTNISAANAGATAGTAGFKFYPLNALDATDYVFEIGASGNLSSIFGVTYAGNLTTGGSIIDMASGYGIRNGHTNELTLRAGGVNVLNINSGGFLDPESSSIDIGAASNGGSFRSIYANTSVQTIMGTATNSFSTAPGVATVNITAAGNAADTTEDNLQTYSLPANAMSANGKGVRYTAWGDGVSTADVTTVKCYFGATAVVTKVLTASQANTWHMRFEVIRTGATSQIASGEITNGGTAASLAQSNASPAETLSGAVTIKCTGQRTVTSSANSVRQLGGIVEFFN